MSLRAQLILKDGKIRPPAILQKVCVHNGSNELERRWRGDMAFNMDFVLGRQEEVYDCLQCGWSISAADMMRLYQAYMLDGGKNPIVIGRNIKP